MSNYGNQSNDRQEGKNYNVNQLWRLFSKDRDARLTVGTFKQNTTFTVFRDNNPGGGNKGPIVRLYLDIAACEKMQDTLRKLLESAPNTRISFVQLRWDKDSRSNKISAVLVFGKAEDSTYYIEASGPDCSTPIIFPFTPIAQTEVDGKPDTPMESSTFSVRSLMKILQTYVPMAEMLTTWDLQFKPRAQQDNSGTDNSIF